MVRLHTLELLSGARSVESHASPVSLLPAVLAALKAGKCVRLTGETTSRIRHLDVDAMGQQGNWASKVVRDSR